MAPYQSHIIFLFFTKKTTVIYYLLLYGFNRGQITDNFSSNYFQTRCLSRLFLTIPRNTFLCLDLWAITNSADCVKTDHVNNENKILKVRAHGSIESGYGVSMCLSHRRILFSFEES